MVPKGHDEEFAARSIAARSINIPISTLIDQACRQSHRGRGWRLDFGKCLPKPEKLPKRKPNMESIFGSSFGPFFGPFFGPSFGLY